MKTGNSKIFIDTNILIYFINEVVEYYEKVASTFKKYYDENFLFYTSVITKSELLLKLIEEKNREKIILFNEILKDFEFYVVEIDSSIAIEAAFLRTKYKSLKLPDALQVASATINNCDIFFSNDAKLQQIDGIKFIGIE